MLREEVSRQFQCPKCVASLEGTKGSSNSSNSLCGFGDFGDLLVSDLKGDFLMFFLIDFLWLLEAALLRCLANALLNTLKKECFPVTFSQRVASGSYPPGSDF